MVESKVDVSLVIWNTATGGIQKTILDYLRRLKEDINFDIFSLREVNETDNLFDGTGVTIHSGSSSNGSLYRKLYAFASGNRDRIFHLFNAGPMILFILRLARVKKIIYHIHGTIYWKTPLQKIKRKFFWKLALSPKVRILSNSQFSKQRFLEQISPKATIDVIYNPIDASLFPLSPPVEKEKKAVKEKRDLKILYIGRLAKGKNLPLWLDAAEQILKDFPQTTFNLVGEGPLKDQLAAKVKEKGLDQQVHFLGFTDDVARAYREHDLLLFLSQYESFGNVVVESILTGTPVIASGIPSMKEIFKNFPQFMVELETENLLETITTKLKDLDNLYALTQKARSEFRDRFSLKKHIDSLKNIYQQKQ